ncbi:MAG: DNA gyrase subunit A, partial [Clostridia bacterium]|nr:DNA gyrase subunit A [Clostridia bacterium]
LNQLYKYTQLQDRFGIIFLALVEGQPKILGLHNILHHYLEHQKEIVTRGTQYDLNKAKAREHILEGLKIALDNLDEVIKTIRGSKDAPTAKGALMDKFGLTEKQAQAILDMRLQRLTGLEREKLEQEYRELLEKIKYFESILADENLLMGVIRKDLLEIKEKYGDSRRTKITFSEDDIDIEDLIPDEEVVVTITHRGYIKRMPIDTYKSQRRGGKGVIGLTTVEDDTVEHLFIASTHHYLLFFTNRGQYYRLKVYEIPEAGRQARGQAIINMLHLEKDEWITAVIPVRNFTGNKFLLMATKYGIVKKTHIGEYDSSRRDGIIAINLDEDDDLIGVRLTDGSRDIILATKRGKGIRFDEKDVRSIGRVSRGVKGIDLDRKDTVVGLELTRKNAFILVVTDAGYGKRTAVEEYRSQRRGGKGVITLRHTDKNGRLVTIQTVKEDEELMIITGNGIIIRQEVEGIPIQGRSTQGVKLIRLDEDDEVVSVARLTPKTVQEEEHDLG